MTPMGRLGKPDELNGLAVFLSSDAARFVTGSNVFCDVSKPSCSTPLFMLMNRTGGLSCLLIRPQNVAAVPSIAENKCKG